MEESSQNDDNDFEPQQEAPAIFVSEQDITQKQSTPQQRQSTSLRDDFSHQETSKNDGSPDPSSIKHQSLRQDSTIRVSSAAFDMPEVTQQDTILQESSQEVMNTEIYAQVQALASAIQIVSQEELIEDSAQ